MTAIASRPLTQSKDSLLRFALRADAVLSGLGGIALGVAAYELGSVTGLSRATEIVVGAFCVGYGLAVFGLAARESVRGAGVGVAIANLVGTVALVGLVVAGVLPLTTTGVVALLAGAAYMALIADLQYLGVRRLRA